MRGRAGEASVPRLCNGAHNRTFSSKSGGKINKRAHNRAFLSRKVAGSEAGGPHERVAKANPRGASGKSWKWMVPSGIHAWVVRRWLLEVIEHTPSE